MQDTKKCVSCTLLPIKKPANTWVRSVWKHSGQYILHYNYHVYNN